MSTYFMYMRKETGHVPSEIASPSPPHLSSTHLVGTYSWLVEVSVHLLATS